MQFDNRTILYKVANKFNLKRNSTEERLKLQKTIYLLQTYGLQLGYGFSWYRYGPYSQDLVYDAYMVLGSEKNRYERTARSWNFSDGTINRFNEFRNICGDVLNNPKQLELVASVDFVRKTWHPEATQSKMPKIFKIYKERYFNGDLIEDDGIKKAFAISDRLKR